VLFCKSGNIIYVKGDSKMARGRRATPKTALMYGIEAKYGKDIKSVIVDVYERTGTLALASSELGIEVSTLSKWFSRFGITLHRTAQPADNSNPTRTPVLTAK